MGCHSAMRLQSACLLAPSPPLASPGGGLLHCGLPYGEAHGAGNPVSANLEASPHEVTPPSPCLRHEDPAEPIHRSGRW